jgi:hypothetical protein
MAIDGGKDLWVTESAFGGILKAPVNNPTAALRSVYLDPGGTSKVSGMKFLHGTGKGGTMTMPYGIGVDATGNVWATNAGCIVNACAPSDFTLTEIIGAGFLTNTPISGQIPN